MSSAISFEVLYRKGEHALLVESFPLWFDNAIDSRMAATEIIHSLNIFLTTLSEFGLAKESNLLPGFNDYMKIFFKLNTTSNIQFLSDELFEKHLIILIDGYSQADIAREEYFSFEKIKKELDSNIGQNLSDFYERKLATKENKNASFNWIALIKRSRLYLKPKQWLLHIGNKINSPEKIGVGISVFFLILILLWIRKNVPRFWSRILTSSSFLAYSLLAPI